MRGRPSMNFRPHCGTTSIPENSGRCEPHMSEKPAPRTGVSWPETPLQDATDETKRYPKLRPRLCLLVVGPG